MPTGLVVRIHIVLLLVSVCFLAMLLFLRRVRSSLVSQSHPPSLNIRLRCLLVLKLYGCEGC
jgi:hypothetical protein